MQDPVRIGEEIAQSGLAQQIVVAGLIAAFRQPNAARPPVKLFLVMIHGRLQLGSHRFGMDHERQIAVGGGAGDDFQETLFLQGAETADQIAVEFLGVSRCIRVSLSW